MDRLFSMVLEMIQHHGRRLFFDKAGVPYYGKDEDNLIHPGGLDIYSKFPLCLTDIVNAFKLGQKSLGQEIVMEGLTPGQARVIAAYHNKLFHDEPTAHIEATDVRHRYLVRCPDCAPPKEGF